MKLYVKIALAVVTFLAISGILVALYMFNLKHTNLAKAKPDFVLTSSDLQKEFEVNQTMASAKYIKKIIEVSGIVSSVTQADSNNFNISLKTGNDISSVICTFSGIGDLLKFKSGSNIVIRGECSGYTQLFPGEPPLDVLLNNCAVAAQRK
jgi:hypothetical protein